MELRRTAARRYAATNRFPGLWVAAALMGLLALAGASHVLGWLRAPPKPDPTHGLMASLGLLLFAAGLASYRRGLVLDLGRGQALRWSSMLGIPWRRRLSLDQVTQVQRRRRTFRGRNSSVTCTVVELIGPGLDQPFELVRQPDHALGEQLAHDIAKVLEQPLITP